MLLYHCYVGENENYASEYNGKLSNDRVSLAV